jgi:NAD(P)-dependent dehydrogenase (short-subunit alcohol dehydrogenase family)
MPAKRPARQLRPRQQQRRQPGREKFLRPASRSDGEGYQGCGLLRGKVAIVTGGDSGIGRAVVVAFAKEGADIVFDYLEEGEDAAHTVALVERAGRRCLAVRGDLTSATHRRRLVDQARRGLGRIDILVNNAAVHFPADRIEDLDWRQVERTFAVNIFAPMRLTALVVPHLDEGACIINTASVVAYRGSAHLLDYAATKGALIAWTRALSSALVERGIRVNAVAPGPIWTPLIAASFTPKEVATFGSQTPMRRAGQPDEVAPAYVLLASGRGSYITGQCIHVNGGEIVNA